MSKVYVLIYTDSLGSRQALKDWANASDLIRTWRHDLPSCFYLVSEHSAAEIYTDIVGTFGKQGRFLILEVNENRQGLLPADSWYLLRKKRLRPKNAG